ncbi:XRE family transcriptional regulator [Herbaspirillum hiltneri N3]|uniref:XRE family transcriptional regulator n=1 Tax=Herbaspirillum hiltneri N3 TaxID=1262470 RepID=A0ABM5V4S7_9BURK|nr:response regulator transcription factor [Herbaspirillum hiltneri]AKZ64618.1 XRE family transcriptional regulator [Herbaspirillum hiltneri N3]
MRILLVEDDLMVGEAVRKGLRQDGFAVDWVQDGVAAQLALRQEDYALVLLDLGLPQKNGLDVLQELRASGSKVPVLIATARDAVADRVAGLDAGADDYLIKPYDLEELSARMRALLRRQSGRADSLIEVRGVSLNPATREVLLQGLPVTLSAREFTLLQAFLDRPGVVLSRAQLEEKLYGWDDSVDSNAVEVHIHALRKKLGSDFIKNVRGIGYLVPK